MERNYILETFTFAAIFLTVYHFKSCIEVFFLYLVYFLFCISPFVVWRRDDWLLSSLSLYPTIPIIIIYLPTPPTLSL